MATKTIVGIAGSLRKGSFNAMLLRAAADSISRVKLGEDTFTIEIGSIRDIPLYDGDLEAAEGIPPAAKVLKDRIAAADGLLLVTPEYNHSIPGVFKNAIDWLSRPPSDSPRVFANRPVGLMGASPGRMGTILSQAAWLPVLRTLGTRPWFGGQLLVSGAAKVFDESGKIVDDQVTKQLDTFLAGFAAFVASSKATR